MKRETWQGYELPTIAEARKWANALRSGEYKQTKGLLNNEDGHCCLGVACRLFIPKGQLELSVFGYILGQLPDTQVAPLWLDAVNTVCAKVGGLHLSDLNDSNYSFNEIADIIELVFIYARKDIFIEEEKD